jgi:branched-chain amino acid transport system substrate-binding protein
VALASTAALAVAACAISPVTAEAAGSGEPTSSAHAGGIATTPAPASGEPIVIGSVGSYTGPNASSNGVAQIVLEVWAEWVNANGGVAGRPVEFIIKDDATDPARGVTAVRELISEGVVAIVGNFSNVDTSWAEEVSEAGVPVVGGIVSSPPFVTNPNFFPNGPGGALPYGLASTARTVGESTAVVYCAESPGCKGVSDIVSGLGDSLDLDVAYTVALSAGEPDYTAACLAIQDAEVQSVIMAVAGATGVQVIQTCQEQGLDVEWLFANGAANGTVANALDDFIDVDTTFPYFDDSTPSRQAFHDALAEYAPDVPGSDAFGPQAAVAWSSAMLFKFAVEAAVAEGATEITPETVRQGLYALPADFTADGTAPPLNFTEGTPQPEPIICWTVWGKQDGEFYFEPEPACGDRDAIIALQKSVYQY